MYFENELKAEEGQVLNTVRRGVKWASSLNELVILRDTQGKAIGMGIVVNIKVKRFCDITKEDIKANFEEDCKFYPRLEQRMKELYGNFDSEEIVTLVDFKVKKKL